MELTPWETQRLGAVLTLQRGFDLPKRLRRYGAVPIVTSSGVEDYHDEAKVKSPGVVTGRYGTIGKVFFITQDFWPLNTTLYVRDFHGNDPLFVSYLLRTIDFHTHSEKSGVPGVNRNDLHELAISVPRSRPEQNVIAAALYDTDAFIESLEQLLAKKRQIKQGAMQELLSGERRLPGFRTAWTSKRLGEFGRFLKGNGVTREESATGDLPCVRYGELYTQHENYIRAFYSWISEEVARSATRVRRGDILFAGSGETKEEIGKAAAVVADVKAYAGGDIVILRNERADPMFLGYSLNMAAVNRQKASRGQGDSVVHISARSLTEVEVELPQLDEQIAIATVLRDLDEDIFGLQAKLLNVQRLKQGMMQELLTGRIRLVD